MNELDTSLYDRLKLLLSSESPIFDNMVQEAALKSTAILVRRYVCSSLHRACILKRALQLPGNGGCHGKSSASFCHVSTLYIRIRVRYHSTHSVHPPGSCEVLVALY